jgi:DNA polymerase III sliding clamp (beta) subunit (PCNA family)
VTFETATFVDAVSKAARVAPTKGAAFDVVAGIVFHVEPEKVTIRATNLEVSYLETLDTLAVEDVTDRVTWRLPSILLGALASGLPIGSGRSVTLRSDGSQVVLQSGKTKAKLNTIRLDGYREWDAFDPAGLEPVIGFADRVAQVSWACDKSMIPITGVHIDGTHLYATDRYRMVRVPLTAPVIEPITVPLEVLTPLLKSLNEVRIGVGDTGLLHMMPDEHTQMVTTIFDAPYPPIERGMHNGDDSFTVDREALKAALTRMVALVKTERYPRVRVDVDPSDGALALFMEIEGVGDIADEVPITADEHARPAELHFTPGYLLDALDGARKPEVVVHYDADKPTRPTKFEDGDGYECWIVPRKKATPGDAA